MRSNPGRTLTRRLAYTLAVGVLAQLPVLGVSAQALPSAVTLAVHPQGQSATLLPDGRWLFLGGEHNGRPTSGATLIEPRTNTTTVLVSQLSHARSGHTATVLPDGGVLVIGGVGVDGQLLRSVERFDPTAQRFDVVNLDLSPRAEHTATMLTDGRLLIAGGLSRAGDARSDVEVVNALTGEIERFDARLETARFGHLAALLPSAPVLIWGGLGNDGKAVETPELFDPVLRHFEGLSPRNRGYLPDPSLAASIPAITGVQPDAGGDLPIDGTIALRFSKPLDVSTISTTTFSLLGPNGVVPIAVIAAEGGLLAFVTPRQELNPLAAHTLFVRGAADNEAREMPFAAIGFRTGPVGSRLRPSSHLAAATRLSPFRSTRPEPEGHGGSASASGSQSTNAIPRQTPGGRDRTVATVAEQGTLLSINDACGADSDEEWVPDLARVTRTGWNTRREPIPPRLARIAAPSGTTAIAGVVLRLNGRPLADVTVHAGDRETTTDADGSFLLQAVPAGAQTLRVGGGAASCDAAYGYYEIRVVARLGVTTALSFPIWLSRLDFAAMRTIAAPTTEPIVLTSPKLPGLEVRIPAGTLIRDRNGRIVTEIGITPIPNDRPPYPMPEIAEFPVYFSLQPGEARLEGIDGRPRQAQVVYPNYTQAAPDRRATFWNYDASEREWHPYGTGRVNEEGSAIVPGPGVGLYQFSGFAISTDPNPPPCDCDCCGGGPGGPGDPGGGPSSPEEPWPANPNVGDPVHTPTGQFAHSHTDFSLPDVLPLTLRRFYYSRDGRHREFGYGMMSSLEMYLHNPNPVNYNELWLVTQNGGKVVFTCTTACTVFSTARHVAQTDPGYFNNATIDWVNPIGWQLTTKDGTKYMFYKTGAYLLSVTDRAGNATTYERNEYNEVTRVLSPNGRWLAFSYGGSHRIIRAEDNLGRAWTYTYDSSGRMTSATDPMGGQWQYTWDGTSYRMLTVRDPRGNVMVTNQYDANGRVVQQTYADTTTNLIVYTVNGGGMVTQADVTDRRGNVRRIEFDVGGRVSRNTFALGLPEQQVTTFTRQVGTNLLTRTTDALGRNTDYTYDAKGNVLTMTRLAGTANAVTTTYTYTTAFNRVASIKDPLNRTTTFTYDSKGNLTRITDPLAHQTNLTYSAQGQVLTVRNALNHTTTYTYAAGVLASIKDPLNRTTNLYSDALGRVVRMVDPMGNATTTTYDALDRVTATTDPLGGTVVYEYDGSGNLTAHVDQKSNRTTYGYDSMNRQASRTDALLHSDAYAYDFASKLARFTDRQSQVSGFTYDALNRRTQAGFGATPSNPTAYTSTIGYGFDAGNRMTSAVDSQNGTITRSYDGLDRLLQEVTPQGTVSYTYYANGLRQTMTVTGQSAVTYSYDNANRLTSIVQGSQTVGFTYDNANRRTQISLPNGITINYAYDTASQLTGITYVKGTTLGDLTYTYDAAGRRISIGGSFARTNLPAAIPTTSHNGNNQLTQWGAPTLTYDLNGNLTADGTYNYLWNTRRQLSGITQGATPIASYAYDAMGRRESKTLAGTITSFVYDGRNFVQEKQGATILANLITGLTLDEVYVRAAGTGSEYFLPDALNTILSLTDATGAQTTIYSYEPYGKIAATGSASGNAQTFTGREGDAGTALMYYRARYFSTEVGRFLSEDPIDFVGGANVYAYVANDPIGFADPLGLQQEPGPPRPPRPPPIRPPNPIEDQARRGRFIYCVDRTHSYEECRVCCADPRRPLIDRLADQGGGSNCRLKCDYRYGISQDCPPTLIMAGI